MNGWAYWAQVLEPSAAVLPPLGLMQVWLRLGWGLVLAALALALVARWRSQASAAVRRGVALVLLAWCAWPGEASPAFGLGLAFQAPSLSAGALALLVLVRAWAPADSGMALGAARALQHACGWAWPAVVLGWVLLLDTFAVWPMALYPTGFGVAAWVLVALVLLAPWAWRGGHWSDHGAACTGLAVWLAFAGLRLPTGNLWDALLDPLLWLLAHGQLLLQMRNRYKKRSGTARFDGG